MGIMQKAIETYDCLEKYVGIAREGQHAFAPISHILTKADIEVTIDREGTFIQAEAVEKDAPKIIIPVTEASAGRTSKPVPHPLCEQLGFLSGFNEEKYSLYLNQLMEWNSSEYSHPFLSSILKYVQNRTIVEDLRKEKLIKSTENAALANDKSFVCWRVIGYDEESACWLNKSLMKSFILFYRDKKNHDRKEVCMLTGEYLPIATQHPKGIISLFGNAKYISANDTSGFTYRGRFTDDLQASTISYEASQKAHNALRWIIADQGVVIGGRTFLSWNPKGKKVCDAVGPFYMGERIEKGEYKKKLYDTLMSYKSELDISDQVIIAVFDAATTGRLALTYYNELVGSDYLKRLYDWDLKCSWENGKKGVQSPSLKQIINCAFGVEREEKGKAVLRTDEKLASQQMQRLLACRIDSARFPTDIKSALVNRASMPQAYQLGIWRNIIFTTCSVLNKYYSDRKGEDEMGWKLDENDRSFQYGRLLAVMDWVEQSVYMKSNEDLRQTTAIKSMSDFRRHPFTAYERVNRHLQQAYIPRADRYHQIYYERYCEEIIGYIAAFPKEDLNKPLDDTYLLGYDLQRSALFTK